MTVPPHITDSGWRAVEVSLPSDSRVPELLEMVDSLSRASTAREVLQVFRDGFPRITRTQGYISLSTRDLEKGQYRITRQFLDAGQLASGDARHVWSEYEKLPVHEGGILGSIVHRVSPVILHDLEVMDDPVLGDGLKNFGALMALPLFDGGVVKNWAIPLSIDPQGYGISEVEEALLNANLVGGTVRRVLLGKLLLEAKQRDADEIERISRIQRALLPTSAPEIEGIQVAAACETFDRAGGDQYQFSEMEWIDPEDGLPAHGMAILVADASGHGPAAAVVAAMCTVLVRSVPRKVEGAADILERLNVQLAATPIEGSFTTAFIGLFNPRTRNLVHASAGHPPPLLRMADGSITSLEHAGGLPLGISTTSNYEQAHVKLEPGTTVAAFTDGITETFAPDGSMFGDEGVREALDACSGDAECSLEMIMSRVRAFESGVRPADDQTLIIMQLD